MVYMVLVMEKRMNNVSPYNYLDNVNYIDGVWRLFVFPKQKQMHTSKKLKISTLF